MRKEKAQFDGPDYEKGQSRSGIAAEGHDRIGAESESHIEAMEREANHYQDYPAHRIVRIVEETQRPETHLRRNSGPLLNVWSMSLILLSTARWKSHQSTKVKLQRTLQMLAKNLQTQM